MTKPAQREEEAQQLALFRRVWTGAAEIASAELSDRPDVRGMLVGGRPLGIEIVTLTENRRAHSDDAIVESLYSELQVAAKAAGVNASFNPVLHDWQANRLVDRAHRATVVSWLIQLAQEAGDQRLDLNDRALRARGVDYFDCIMVDPIPEGVGLIPIRVGGGRGSESIRERIAKKDDLVPTYRAEIGSDAALWLLLVTGFKLADSVACPMPHETFETRFDRVFFLECWKEIEKVTELNVRPRG